MRSIARTAIFLKTFAAILLAASFARADQTTDQTAEFLARAAAANSRCNVLSPADAQDLSAFASAANQSGKLKVTTKRGAAVGASVRCDETTARGIRGVLKSARNQGLAKSSQSTAPVSTVSQLVNLPAQQATPVAAPEKPVQGQRALTGKKPGQPEYAGLKRYEAMAAKYYRELRCPTLSRSDLLAFYENVIQTYRKSVAIYGSVKVSAVVRSAAARAKSGNC